MTRALTILLLVVCSSCEPSHVGHHGSMTPELRELLQQDAGCDKLVETRSFARIRLMVDLDESIIARFRERPIVAVTCEDEDSPRLVYTSDDNALVTVQAMPGTTAAAKEWLYQLRRAGVDASLINKAREHVVAEKDNFGQFRGDGVEVSALKIKPRTSRPPPGQRWVISVRLIP